MIWKIIILEVEKTDIYCPLQVLDWSCLKRQKKINMYLNMTGKGLPEYAEESTLGNQRNCGTENS